MEVVVRDLESRVKALEEKVAQLETQLKEKPSKQDVSSEINYRTKNFVTRSEASRSR